MHDHTWHDKQDRFSEITKAILGCCFEVINTLGSGFAESVDQLSSSDKFIGWPIGELWKKKIGVQKELTILHIMPRVIMQILSLFEAQKSCYADLVKQTEIGSFNWNPYSLRAANGDSF